MLKHKYIRLVFLIISAGCIAGWLLSLNSLWWLGGIVFMYAGITAWGVFDIRRSYFLPVLFAGDPSKNKQKISLTFDDGPTEYTPEVLDLLAENNCKATFFCIGKQIEKYPEIAVRIVEEGHIIANHTYSHAAEIGFSKAEEIRNEIEKTNQLIEQKTGKKTVLFRPPFGVTNPMIAKAAVKVRNRFIGWNIRSLDTVIQDEKKITRRIAGKLRSGGIILMHDTSKKSVAALEQLLLIMKQKKYEVIPLDELLNIQVYEK